MQCYFKPSVLMSALVYLALPLTAMAQGTLPKYVAGKVVAVSHEKVSVNPNQILDKITVTVDNCDARGTLKTVTYSPATVSDRTVLGHLFDQTIHSARTANMESQQRPNGYGLFWVDDTGRVLRTGILGESVDCKAVPQVLGQFSP